MIEEYTLQVTFTRQLAEDADVIGKPTPTPQELVKQFCKELQEAYDEGWMSGHFQVSSIKVGSTVTEIAP